MNTQSFSIEESLRKGWELTRSNFGMWLAVGVIFALINLVPELFNDDASNDFQYTSILLNLIFSVISTLLGIGLTKIALLLLDGKKAEVMDLFRYPQYLVQTIIGAIIYMVMVFIGLIFLVIPGIYVALKYQFFSEIIIDKNVSALEALQQSGEITKGNLLNLFIAGIVLAVVFILGIIALGIGLFVTFPVVTLAYTYIYRQLMKAHKPAKAE
jgi:uncharacterized membrane protein